MCTTHNSIPVTDFSRPVGIIAALRLKGYPLTIDDTNSNSSSVQLRYAFIDQMWIIR